jgi:hypothetical protein
MSDTFFERMDFLRTLVPAHGIEAYVEVDQVYARYQDGWGDPDMPAGTVITPTQISRSQPGVKNPTGKAGPTFDHPMGGEAGYLSLTLTRRAQEYKDMWCEAIDNEQKFSEVTVAMVEDLAQAVFELAPIEFWILRMSAHPVVKVDDIIEYDRPPLMPRLSQEELDAMRPNKTGVEATVHGPRKISSSAAGKTITSKSKGL